VGVGVRKGLGFGVDCDWTAGRCRARPGFCPEVGGDPDRWGPPISGRERRERYPFGFFVAGLWAGFGAGPNLSPAASFSFPNFFHFSFLFYFIYFANLLQIKSNKFLGPSNIHCSVLKH
jgi:hypothetical protein